MSDCYIISIQSLIRGFLTRRQVRELKLFKSIKEQYIIMLEEHALEIINKFLRYCINRRRVFYAIKSQYLEMKEKYYHNIIRKFLRFCIKKRSVMKSNSVSPKYVYDSRHRSADLIESNDIENMFSTIKIRNNQ